MSKIITFLLGAILTLTLLNKNQTWHKTIDATFADIASYADIMLSEYLDIKVILSMNNIEVDTPADHNKIEDAEGLDDLMLLDSFSLAPKPTQTNNSVTVLDNPRKESPCQCGNRTKNIICLTRLLEGEIKSGAMPCDT